MGAQLAVADPGAQLARFFRFDIHFPRKRPPRRGQRHSSPSQKEMLDPGLFRSDLLIPIYCLQCILQG